MKFPPLVKGTFMKRLNRFVCEITVGREKTTALLRNTGRLGELLKEGGEVYLREKEGGKHPYELILVKGSDSLVCVDSHLPPRLLYEYLTEMGRPWRVHEVRFEYRVGDSRFDLLINGEVLVETKSVNLVKNGTALFPDAPTERGARHVEHLMALKDKYHPALVFVVQREDAECFSPNREMDPRFSDFVRRFAEEKLPVHAFLCRVDLDGIYIWKEIPVRII